MTQPLLAVDDLHIYFHTPTRLVRAVNGISFAIDRDEVFGLVGESGCGKSTLCLGVLGLISPPGRIERGRILFNGQDLAALSPAERRRVLWRHIAYIPQGAMSSLNPVIRIREQFYDVVWDHEGRVDRRAMQARIENAIDKVGLQADVLKRFPHQLSGGMKQRVCIALAIILEPELIIADEPTSALDVVSQRLVLETLLDVRQKTGASMIMIGHDMALEAQVATRMGIMYAGRFAEIGPVRDIFKSPLHPYTQRLIASIPSIRDKRELRALAQTGANTVAELGYQVEGELVEVGPGHFVTPAYAPNVESVRR